MSSNIVVLRVRTHRIADSEGGMEPDLRWSVLGELSDLNPKPFVLGQQKDPYVYLVSAADLGLDPDICMAYLKAFDAWSALIREEAFEYNGAPVYSRQRDAEEETMGYFGEKIDAAVSLYFEPADEVPVTTTAPPWAGLYPSATTKIVES
jgi:hypothetical protein